MKSKSTMPASVLASVLVVCTLVLTTLLFVISLWNSDLLLFARCLRQEQQRANVSSAFVRYCHDSTFLVDSTCLLFEEDVASRVRLRRERWGLYEVVRIYSEEGEWEAVRLFGKACESPWEAALYVPDGKRTLSLSGVILPEGKICVGENGIAYTQVRSEFLETVPVSRQRITVSEEQFPAFDQETLETVARLFSFSGGEKPCPRSPRRQSFREPVSFFKTGEGDCSGLCLEGHIVLMSDGRLDITEGDDLWQIIVVASSVRISDGFRGCIQVFARDSIILGDQVCLGPGSGLWVEGDHPARLIRLGNGSEVNGYVVVNGCPGKDRDDHVHYYQPLEAKVRGLIYVDGMAEVHGLVNGSLYARDFRYFAPEGYYSGLLYRVAVLRQPGVAYPFLMAGTHERRCVEWLD